MLSFNIQSPFNLGARERSRARFSKASENFWFRTEVIFSSSVFENREVYTPETSDMEGTSVHIKNT